MLNKKIVESIFKDLNASAAKEWRDDCYLKLLYFEELEDDKVCVVFTMGKDDVTYYSVFAPNGYEYHRQGSGSNIGDAESVMQTLMQQYDSPHYFVLAQIEGDEWKLTDEVSGIRIEWKAGEYKKTRTFSDFYFDRRKYSWEESEKIIVTILQHMTDWLVDNYPELIQEFNERQLFGLEMARLRKQQGYSIRELAERCGCSTATIVNIEKGKFSPRLEIVQQILAAMDCHLEIVPNEHIEEDEYFED